MIDSVYIYHKLQLILSRGRMLPHYLSLPRKSLTGNDIHIPCSHNSYIQHHLIDDIIIVVAIIANIYSFTKASHLQLTAKLAIGSGGANAVRLATVEPRREDEMSSKNQRTGELHVRLWRRQWSATLWDAQVLSSSCFLIFIIFIFSWPSHHLPRRQLPNW